MDITTYDQLENQMNKICEEVILKVSDKILKNLKDTIKRDVYKGHGPNVMYPDFDENNSEFYNAWEWEQIETKAKSLSRTMFYNWQGMTTEPRSYRHIDYLSGRDSREKLPEILNINGFDMGINGEGNPISRERRVFWNEFILDMTVSGQISNWFVEEFSKFGIKR